MPRDPNNPRWGFQPEDPMVRFLRKVESRFNGCWLWTGTVTKNGYGRFGVGTGELGVRKGQSTWAHRAAWVLFRGPIPLGMELDHLCRNRRCVNPDHLEPVTHAENVRRGLIARGPLCQRGLHDLTVPGSRNSKGACRLCTNAHMRAYGRTWRANQKAKRQAEEQGETVLMFI